MREGWELDLVLPSGERFPTRGEHIEDVSLNDGVLVVKFDDDGTLYFKEWAAATWGPKEKKPSE